MIQLETKNDNLEQYSHRNCLVIHGIKEDNYKSTDELALNFFKEQLNVNLNQSEIDRSHRLPSIADPKPIIVKLTRYNTKQML